MNLFPSVRIASRSCWFLHGVSASISGVRLPRLSIHSSTSAPAPMTETQRSCKYTTDDDGSTHLTWTKDPSNILVIKKINALEVRKPFKQLVLYLCRYKERELSVTIESHAFEELKTDVEFSQVAPKLKKWSSDEGKDPFLALSDIDLVVCMGGDGTLLYLSSLFQEHVPPVLPVHIGSLGFLMTQAFADFKKALDRTLTVQADSVPLSVTTRARLDCELQLCSPKHGSVTQEEVNRKVSPSGYTVIGPRTRVSRMAALNEVVIDRGASPYLTGLELVCNGQFVADVQGDGVIIATPTGSTAYAAAAGGPMVEPSVPGIIVAPICPHSLSFRPIVVGLKRKLEVRVPMDSRVSAWVSCDGRNRQQVHPGDSVLITSHRWPMTCINNKATMPDWFTSLGECLQWNVRVKQKPFDYPSSP